MSSRVFDPLPALVWTFFLFLVLKKIIDDENWLLSSLAGSKFGLLYDPNPADRYSVCRMSTAMFFFSRKKTKVAGICPQKNIFRKLSATTMVRFYRWIEILVSTRVGRLGSGPNPQPCDPTKSAQSHQLLVGAISPLVQVITRPQLPICKAIYRGYKL